MRLANITSDVIKIWKEAETEQERKSIEKMFLLLTGMEFSDFIANCEKKKTSEKFDHE